MRATRYSSDMAATARLLLVFMLLISSGCKSTHSARLTVDGIRRRRSARLVAGLLAAALATAPELSGLAVAYAQEPNSFAALAEGGALTPGQKIWIDCADVVGRELIDVEAEFVQIDRTALTVRIGGEEIVLPAAGIRKVEVPEADGVGDGAIKGAGYGLLAMGVTLLAASKEGWCCAGGVGEYGKVALRFAALGALAGTAIDAARRGRRVVYRAAESNRVEEVEWAPMVPAVPGPSAAPYEPRRHESPGRVVGGAPTQVIDRLRGAVEERSRTSRRWTITYTGAWAGGGPASDIEKELEAVGFGDTQPGYQGIFFGTVDPRTHPYTSKDLGGVATLHYAFDRPWGAALVYSDIQGTTTGYRSSGGHSSLSGQELEVNYDIRTIASLITYQVTGGVRLGAGPAYYLVRSGQSAFGERLEPAATKIGLLGDVSVVTSSRARIFFELRGQYRLVGSRTIGPFLSDPWWFFSPSPKLEVGPMKVSHSHWSLGAGLGIRF